MVKFLILQRSNNDIGLGLGANAVNLGWVNR